MTKPEKGILLIANPFLKDPNFIRTVVMICDHEEGGSFGLTLNKRLDIGLKDVMPDVVQSDIPLYMGGPVQPDTLHFVHQYPELIPDSIEILNGVYWGGNFESLKIHLNNNDFKPEKIKFFIGYSGWGEGQLDMELKEDSWLTVKATKKLIFDVEPQEVWKESLREMGGEYEMLINYPLDPQLN